ncbi:elongation factor P hydroxylase [Pleionea sp. CnH1-48]|uniref:elongation factor P hydroxylase n=1 Tax=Pleionea sp. CnH1-48 TaxID=2954494 RepID=UPI00209821F0|nr:elongation factor P hydroxylase [Pleionea sp. CnH1-48]MCO7223640.1 elongation factor P hydroxylase [Pleionea sp. CnH1-48]
MLSKESDDELCRHLVSAFAEVFPHLLIQGGADEPFYSAPKENAKATLYFRSNYPRSLLHEMSHYCLAGEQRRAQDDFGFWYVPCGRTQEQQEQFEKVEARPQGLEKAMCDIIGIDFSPSIDDFSGRPPSDSFLQGIETAYNEMLTNPPPTAKKAIQGLSYYMESCC